MTTFGRGVTGAHDWLSALAAMAFALAFIGLATGARAHEMPKPTQVALLTVDEVAVERPAPATRSAPEIAPAPVDVDPRVRRTMRIWAAMMALQGGETWRMR